MEKIIPALAAAFILTGCSTPTVNLATSEPIKVDIEMRLDVYQHNPPGTDKKPSQPQAPTAADPESRRRNRMADVQAFKNSRAVGEGRDGLLSIRVETPGDYGDYIRKTVSAENEDRMALMKAVSAKEKISLPDVQKKQAALWQKMSFRGEWIEVQTPDGNWRWIQKEG